MLIVLLLLCQPYLLSTWFYAICGLLFLGACLLHIIIHGKWVMGISKIIAISHIPGKVKINYGINTLLFISLFLVIISGIAISKTTSLIPTDTIWRNIHVYTTSIGLVLLGLHIGFHWHRLGSVIKKIFPLSNVMAKPLGISLVLIFLSFSLCNIVATDLTVRFTPPILISQAQQEIIEIQTVLQPHHNSYPLLPRIQNTKTQVSNGLQSFTWHLSILFLFAFIASKMERLYKKMQKILS